MSWNVINVFLRKPFSLIFLPYTVQSCFNRNERESLINMSNFEIDRAFNNECYSWDTWNKKPNGNWKEKNAIISARTGSVSELMSWNVINVFLRKPCSLISPLKPFNLSSIEIEENPQQVCQILKLIELLIINVIRQSPAKFLEPNT